MNAVILIVDDEASVRSYLAEILTKMRPAWSVIQADSVDQASILLATQRFNAIVSDVAMPIQDGFDLLLDLPNYELNANCPVVMLTGNGDREMRRTALEFGAADLLCKPVDSAEFIARLQNVVWLRAFQEEIIEQNAVLEQRVRERTEQLENSRLTIVWQLSNAAEFRDTDTGQHVVRVGCYSRVLGEAIGLPMETVETLFLASPMHDIGKIGIPDRILLKQGPLTPEERALMETHCELGANILRSDSKLIHAFETWRGESTSRAVTVDNPIIDMAATIALGHHERWDGAGYPRRLMGEEIPLECRIVAIGDVFDALSSERPYKPAYTEGKVMEIIKSECGRHFDPELVAALIDSLEEFRRIREQFADAPPPVRQAA